jgi:hypothetical protein
LALEKVQIKFPEHDKSDWSFLLQSHLLPALIINGDYGYNLFRLRGLISGSWWFFREEVPA